MSQSQQDYSREILYPLDVPQYTHEQWFGMEYPKVPVMCNCKADCVCKITV